MMSWSPPSLLRLVAYIRVVECLTWGGPRPTAVEAAYEAYLDGRPRPTEKPCHKMVERQASMSMSISMSISMSMSMSMSSSMGSSMNMGMNLCGYVSGNQSKQEPRPARWRSRAYSVTGSPITCGASSTCMYHVGNGGAGMAGCCTASNYINCGWNNACVDMAGFMGGDCNSNCSLDMYTVKW
jgi:hypothetical protein